jgi:FkbM family methyltransferase
VATVVRGVRLELHPPPDYVSDTIRATGDFYEAAILDELARRISGGVIVDAGAMLGNHSTYLAEFVPHLTIHAFEPEPSNFRLLRRNVRPYPSVLAYPYALSDRAGRVGIDSDPTNRGHASVVPGGWIRAVTLDTLNLHDVSLIKVDVEGHEPQVLAGARETIARCRPLILLEDWTGLYPALLPGYEIVAEWETAHQTFLFSPIDNGVTAG